MTKKIFPLEEIKQLIESEQFTIKDLAAYYNTSRPTMSKFLRENNLNTLRNKQKQKINQLNENEIVTLYTIEHNTLTEIAKKMGVSTSPIKSILLKNQINLRTNSEAHQKYYVDEHYFEKIDTLSKAYLLGFLCADGFVTKRNEIGIGVNKKDISIVEFFQRELKTNKPIKLIKRTNSAELRVQNVFLFKQITSLGVIPNKSLVLDIGQVIQNAELSDKQIKAFLLGYFDGDGGIYKSNNQYSFSITGTFETCQYFKKYFNNIGFFVKRHNDEKNNWTYQVGGRNQVRKCLSQIYEIADQLEYYYLRKYIIFTEL